MNDLSVKDQGKKLADTINTPEMTSQLAQSMGVPNDSPVVGRFKRALLDAVQRNPTILSLDRASLFSSIKTAAYMGLMPDGREGAIVPQKGKATFQPMVFGLRKIAANHGVGIESHIVYANDKFVHHLGDDARIIHEPAPLGVDRGKVIGAYAIATDKDGRKYREVMSIKDLDRIKGLSKTSREDSPWNLHTDEMHRKTPVKRLFKFIPMPDMTEGEYAAVTHGDDDYRGSDQRRIASDDSLAGSLAALAAETPEEADTVEYAPVAVDSDEPF